MAEPAPVFPFFVGCPRSGTTMLRAMFDAHPDMAVPGESYFLRSIAKNRRRFEGPTGVDVEALVADLRDRPAFRRWELDEGEVRAALDPPPLDVGGAIRGLFVAYAARRGKSRYADKTPDYVLDIPLLAGLLPEARFVHVVRDGRDVALALEDLWGLGLVEHAAFVWRQFVERGRWAGRALGPGRYREVRYEDLLDDPEGHLRDVCQFLELDFQPAMLAYSERAEEVISSFHPGWHAHLQRVKLPPTKGLRDWRVQLAPGEVGRFEVVAGRLLADLGYERAVPHPSLGTRARAAAGLARVAGRRVGDAVRRVRASRRR